MQIQFRTLLILFLGLIFSVSSNALAQNSLITNDQLEFLVLSDMHVVTNPLAPTMEINPVTTSNNNDSDLPTFQNLVQQIALTFKETPAFVLILGDLAGHAKAYHDEIYNDEKAVLDEVNKEFPHTPKLLVFGNNDSMEKDYGAFFYPPGVNDTHSQYQIAIKTGWADGFLSTGTQCSFTNSTYPCISNENENQGYYSAYLAKHLLLISLNSVMFSASKHNTSPQNIAVDQLNWLEKQLLYATLKNDSVIIASHIPIGYNIYDHSSFWRQIDLDRFLQIYSNYQNNIIGILSGHTHMEELKVIRNGQNRNVGAVLFTAALSTSHGNAPSVKTFSLTQNSNKWSIADYTSYYFLHDVTNLKSCYNYVNYYCANNQQDILACVGNVTAEKIFPYYSACNPNYQGTIGSPDDIFITLPNTPKNQASRSSNDNSSNPYGVLGAVAAAGIGAALLDSSN